ncbi:MAG: hypothetical protein P8127_05000, partial [Acidobacteriota bacterium]
AIMRAQGEILRHVVHYQALALKPMIFILPPLVLVMVQLHQFYGFRGLQPGDEVLLTVQLDPLAIETSQRPDFEIDLPPGLNEAMAPVWVPSLNQISWLLEVQGWGDWEIRLDIDGAAFSKTIRATEELVRLSPEKPPRTFVDQLEWPSEPPFEKGEAVRSITLDYPEGSVSVLGWDFEWAFAWMVVFFVLTMVVALVLRKPMGIEL